MPDAPPMSPDRALEINDKLTTVWMIREGWSHEALPDPAGISLHDAVAASEMMHADPALGSRRNADGSTTLTCHVAPSRVLELCAWWMEMTAATRRPWEIEG